MSINLRKGNVEDAEILGKICYEAFGRIADQHNFPRDFPSPEAGIGFASMMLSRPDIYSVVGELNGTIAGSNFLWESDEVAGARSLSIAQRT